jgi:SAM-dependent methyltransferase
MIDAATSGGYTQGALEGSILEALIRSGKDPDRLVPADLAPLDEFHIGGRKATADFAAELFVDQSWYLLDIGSGLGGASRYFAHEFGCRVTGIDLTEEYVRTAEALARRVGLDRQVSYWQGSALDPSFAPGTFDGASMLDVGMNIEAKGELFARVRNVLKPAACSGSTTSCETARAS